MEQFAFEVRKETRKDLLQVLRHAYVTRCSRGSLAKSLEVMLHQNSCHKRAVKELGVDSGAVSLSAGETFSDSYFKLTVCESRLSKSKSIFAILFWHFDFLVKIVQQRKILTCPHTLNYIHNSFDGCLFINHGQDGKEKDQLKG